MRSTHGDQINLKNPEKPKNETKTYESEGPYRTLTSEYADFSKQRVLLRAHEVVSLRIGDSRAHQMVHSRLADVLMPQNGGLEDVLHLEQLGVIRPNALILTPIGIGRLQMP